MRLDRNPGAAPLPREDEIDGYLQRLSKRKNGTVFAVLAVQNLSGELRLRIACHSQEEAAGARQVLKEREFTDALDPWFEETDENGNVFGGMREVANAAELSNGGEFDALYVLKQG